MSTVLSIRRIGVRLAALGLLLTSAARPARALEEMRPLLESKIPNVQKVLEQEGIKEMAVGAFTSDGAYGSEKGPGIAALLTRVLDQAKIKVNPHADVELSGKYFPHVDPHRDRRIVGGVIELTLTRLRPNRRELGKFICPLNETTLNIRVQLTKLMQELFSQELAPMMIVTGAKPVVPITHVGSDVNKVQDRQPEGPYIKDDTFFLRGEDGKPTYGFELFNPVDNSPLKLSIAEDGYLALADVRSISMVAVRLINRSADDAAVELSLDGVNAFEFKDAQEAATSPYFCVPAGGQIEVRGWYVTKSRSDRFTLVSLADGVAAKQLAKGRAGRLGVISAYFQKAYKDKPKGQDVLDSRVIGRGEAQKEEFQTVTRFIDPNGVFLNVRYSRGDALPPQ